MSTLNQTSKKILNDFKNSDENKLAPQLHQNLAKMLEASPPLVKQLNEVSNSKYITKKSTSLVAQHNQKNLSSKENDIDKSVLLKIYVRRLSICLFTMFLSSAHGFSPPLPPDESHDQTSAEINKHLPSHPLNSEQVTQVMTTLIELPFAKINKKNIEKIFSLQLQTKKTKTNYWHFNARENWSIEFNDDKKIQKRNFHFTSDLSEINASSLCLPYVEFENFLTKNNWKIFNYPLPLIPQIDPPRYYRKENKQIGFQLVRIKKDILCIVDLSIGHTK